jgi:putative acetyltransferase
MLTMRPERPQDVSSIRAVNESAFGRSAEADSIEALRRRGQLTLSLVAIQDDSVVGHISFSPVTLETAHAASSGLGLAPLSVLPNYQWLGIGTRLAQAGIAECRKLDCEFVVVLGDPHYYSRFISPGSSSRVKIRRMPLCRCRRTSYKLALRRLPL